jgi:SAM-dependent methyltransferase
MPMDVADLRAFYGSRLGALARRLVGERIRALWPATTGERVLGIGYATPYLGLFGDEPYCRIAFMPAEQGVMRWPSDGRNASALVLDDALPLPEASMDRVLLVHGLEMSDNSRDLLREVWRVLAPGGRVLAVVPNRAGIWARVERTPFGHGRPFSRGQLSALMHETMFYPNAWSGALVMPPWKSKLLLRGGATWERMGSRISPRISGVLILEATKIVQLPVAARSRRQRARAMKPTLSPVTGLKWPGTA